MSFDGFTIPPFALSSSSERAGSSGPTRLQRPISLASPHRVLSSASLKAGNGSVR